ncbi:MAG: hypothetical protein LBH20_04575 [Treponema sp.]|jgi:hypothetical protein|nr:hypothetical protein [Treponema sp.]
MKKIFIAVLAAAFVVIACDNGDVERGTNPYPDGVYPFEVSNVGHTRGGDYNRTVITWTNPTDNGFKNVKIEIYGISESVENTIEFLMYSSVTGEEGMGFFYMEQYQDIILGKDSFSFNDGAGNDKYAVIKCVDKFGNVSNGVKYEFTYQ